MNKLGCLEAFRGKANVAKHPRNVICHVGLTGNGSWRKYDHARKSPNMSQKQPKFKVIIHAFGFSRGSNSERHAMPHRIMRGHWK